MSDLTPKIRFDGFIKNWQQHKFGDLMNITSVKRIHQSDWTNEGVRFLRARDLISAYKNEVPEEYLYISKEKYEEYSILSGKVKVGDMLVTGVGTIGIPYIIKDNTPVYFKDGNIIWFQNENIIEKNFLFYSFNSKTIQDFIFESAGVGTVGTYTIDSGKKTPIFKPDRKEQLKIGELFFQLDNLIICHQRKHENLLKLKKTLLEKMFSIDNEKTPKIRFKGFDKDWGKCKLSDMLIYEQPQEYIISSKIIDEKRDIPVLTAGKSFILGYTEETTGIKKACCYDPVIIFDDFMTTCHYVDFNFKIKSSAMKLLKTSSSKYDFYFAYTLLKSINYKVQNHERHWISKFSQFDINVPENNEQNNEQVAIGCLFKKLDTLIKLYQCKIDALKKIKMSLLEKMFV